MTNWAVAFVVPAVLAVVALGGFLQARYRGAGYPFGPQSRWWAITVIVMVAAVLTGLGVVVAFVSHHLSDLFSGALLPVGLWIGALATIGVWLWEDSVKRLRKRSNLKPLGNRLAFPFRFLEDRMALDMADWCEARIGALTQTLPLMAEALDYYYYFGSRSERVAENKERRRQLALWYYSARHKIAVVRLIETGATADRVLAALQGYIETQNISKYTVDDLPRLARRLLSDAESEFGLLLAYLYRNGDRHLRIYSSKERLAVAERREYLFNVELNSVSENLIKAYPRHDAPDKSGMVGDQALPGSRRPVVSHVEAPPQPNYSVISEMAHSMKTPLAHLEGVVQLLQSDVSVDIQKADALNEMTASIEICRATLAAYRELARVSGAVEPVGPESLDEALLRMHKIYARQSKKGTKLYVNVPASVGGYSNSYILAMLLPLLENAVEASPDTTIDITAQEHRDIIEFLVVNDIEAPVDIDKVVQRGETTKPGHEGLGISVVKHLVSEYADASTSCDVRDGKFVFAIRLPRRQS